MMFDSGRDHKHCRKYLRGLQKVYKLTIKRNADLSIKIQDLEFKLAIVIANLRSSKSRDIETWTFTRLKSWLLKP